MKKKVLLKSLVVLGLMLTSCSKEENGSDAIGLQADIDEISNLAQAGSWRISLFIDSGKDNTGNFEGYQFSFNPDGSLIADSRTDNRAGTWSITTDDNSDNVNESVGNNNDSSNEINIDDGNEVNNVNNGEVSSGDDGNDADSNDDDTAGENGNNGANPNDGADNDDGGNAENNGTAGNDDCNNCFAPEFLEVLTGCSEWFIDKLERNDEDLEDKYSNYRFDFLEDGTLIAKNGSTTYSGTWASNGSDNNITVAINVPNLEEINNTWNLHEIESENDEKKVDLRIGGDDRLRFKNRCNTSAKKDSKVVANITGNNLILNILFANPQNFVDLSKKWKVVTHSGNKIELMVLNPDSGDIDELTFENN